MLKNMNVVILAAGKGTRMRSNTPKTLFNLAGKPILFHVIDLALKTECDDVYVVTGYRADLIRQKVSDVYPKVKFIHQEEQLGTGHALLQTLNHLPEHGRLLVLYGDVPSLSIKTVSALMQGSSQSLQWLSAELPDPSGYGRILRDNTNRVMAIIEDRNLTKRQQIINEVNTGIFMAPISYLRHWLPRINKNDNYGEYLLTDIMAMAHRAGIVINMVKIPADRSVEVQGVNDLWQLSQLERHWQLEKARILTREQGVYFTNPETVAIRGELHCGANVSIDNNCIFEGEVHLEDNVRIGPGSLVRNTTVAADSVIEAFCHLDRASVGQQCQVGPYARLRPGSILANGIKVGNFVEVKNSNLGAGSKVNHLAYIGDAQVGEQVNIGAGTITCNYDGIDKHTTNIGDKVFIGSNSALVAPVAIGNGAYVGAGSTITDDVPDNHLALGRQRQSNLNRKKLYDD